ncbi:MAG: pyridoxal-phosphate dependent enzyme [Alphaproteobacteria bacterium]|nr:pyridoxal-phosphate dependent enzyme [Alphaproteobacteria bacterium]
MGWHLACTRCGRAVPFGPRVTGCAACAAGGVVGLLECVRPDGPAPARATTAGRSMARYRHLLPVPPALDWVSLGEGDTALIRSRHIGPRLGLPDLHFKLEQQNPTLSFKDRYVALTVNLARYFGFRRVVVSSTGNLGVSVAAYAAAAGMACRFVAPRDVPAGILAEAALHGAEVEIVEKERRFARFEALAREPQWFPVGLFMNRAVQNPFGIEAYRTFAYEMIEALGRPPDAVLFPCARGNGLYGAWKGFRDAAEWGWADRTPQMVGCQPTVANSMEASLAAGSPTAIALPPADSVARSICETVTGDKALGAIRESGGTAASAGDDRIIAAVLALGREGINAEAGAATTVACLETLVRDGRIRPGTVVVCVLTGAGHRWPEQAAWATAAPG